MTTCNLCGKGLENPENNYRVYVGGVKLYFCFECEPEAMRAVVKVQTAMRDKDDPR